jgi:hypothetical protein
MCRQQPLPDTRTEIASQSTTAKCMFCGTIHADPDIAIAVHMSNHIVGTVCRANDRTIDDADILAKRRAALTRFRDKQHVPRTVEDRMRHCRFVGAKHSGDNQR